MTSEATRKAERDKELQKEALEIAQREADARSEDELEVLSHTPPLVRDEEHSFVQQEPYEGNPAKVQPDLTQNKDVLDFSYDGRYYHEAEVERMTDEEIVEAGLLNEVQAGAHSRIAPTSERQRTPLQRAPAAGPGTWPVPEDSLPAVMPSDPPKEDGEEPGDATLTGYPPFNFEGRKVVVYSSEGARSEVAPDETVNAAALYLRLRNQFPHFTEDELSDEFIIQWEARVGAKQSFRPSQELSQHGDTAVGDPRVTLIELGEARKDASQAQPNSLPHDFPASSVPPTGLPSVNEPASRAPDGEKELLESGELKAQDKADLLAVQQTLAFKESEETGEPLPEPPPEVSPSSGRNVPLPPPVRSGASEGKGSDEKTEPKVQPEASRPGPAKGQPPAKSEPDKPKGR